MLKKKEKFKNECNTSDHCVRFCCENHSTCNDDFIKKNFHLNNLLQLPDDFEYSASESLNRSIRILYGKPSCVAHTIYTNNGTGMYTFQYNYLYVDDYYYNEEKFCFQDEKINGEIEWKINYCKYDHDFKKIFYLIVFSAAVIMLSTVVIIYAFVRELKTLHGRIVLMSTASLIFDYILCHTPLLDIFFKTYSSFTFIMVFSISFAIKVHWLTIMCFDIWLTFRKLRSSSDGMERFKYYCFYAFGLTGLEMFFYIIGEYFLYDSMWRKFRATIVITFTTFYVIAWILNIVLLIITGIKIFKMSKSSNNSEHSWFESETLRYWKYVSVFGILLVNVINEMMNPKLRSSSDGMERFKYYCCYVFGLTGLQVLFLLGEYLFYDGLWRKFRPLVVITFTAFYFIAWIVHLVLVIITGIKIFKMSKASNNSEHSWFESETLRYWKYVSVFGILLVNVINEMMNPSIDFEMHYSSLSAILVFCS
ncbi:CLUMA_CG008060, isoform B, partial [Clunio marinus]